MIRYLYQDNKERIWGGTSDGLVRFNPGELIRNPDAYVFYNMDLTSPRTIRNIQEQFGFTFKKVLDRIS